MDPVTVLEREASELDPVPVWLRAGQHDDPVVIDMGTETRQAITITAAGWQIQAGSPVIFGRSELTHPLVTPARGGTWTGCAPWSTYPTRISGPRVRRVAPERREPAKRS